MSSGSVRIFNLSYEVRSSAVFCHVLKKYYLMAVALLERLVPTDPHVIQMSEQAVTVADYL